MIGGAHRAHTEISGFPEERELKQIFRVINQFFEIRLWSNDCAGQFSILTNLRLPPKLRSGSFPVLSRKGLVNLEFSQRKGLKWTMQIHQKKINRHVEIVTTDTTGMKETGFNSVGTCRSIYHILKCRYALVHFNEVQNEQDLERIIDRKPDLVVLCVKYIIETERHATIWLSDYFSRHGVPYTGSDRASLEFDSYKSKAKNLLLEKGLATAKFFLAHPGLYMDERHLPLPLPLFVKPLDAANGNSIDENSFVRDYASYEAKIAEIYEAYGHPALVEEVLPGREFTVAVFDKTNHDGRLILPVEIVVPENARGDRILGFQEKSVNREELLMVEEPALTAVSSLAGEVFSALGARDFGRIDIRMDADSVPHFIEANLVPGMTPETSYFPRACEMNQTMSYENVVLKIVELAMSRRDLPADSGTDWPVVV